MLAAALILLVGACDSSSEEATPQQPTASSSNDPAPTATVPTMPAQAAEDSSEGAAAFVKYYVDVFNYAAATGDVDELSRLSSPECDGCQSYIDLYRGTYEAGGYFRGGDWKIGDLHLETRTTESLATTKVTSGRSKFRESRDVAEEIGKGTNTELTFVVSRPDPGRQVTGLMLSGGK
jgi:hypothetical protein